MTRAQTPSALRPPWRSLAWTGWFVFAGGADQGDPLGVQLGFEGC